MFNKPVKIFDRVVSILSYLSAGWIGMIVCVLLYFSKKHTSHFLRFNVFQSIFISLLYFVISMAIGLILQFISYIPFLNYVVAQIAFLFNRSVLFDYSLIQLFTLGLVVYTTLLSALGIYPRIFKISSIIDYAARG